MCCAVCLSIACQFTAWSRTGPEIIEVKNSLKAKASSCIPRLKKKSSTTGDMNSSARSDALPDAPPPAAALEAPEMFKLLSLTALKV